MKAKLSERESLVYQLRIEGRSYKAVAAKLHTTEGTIGTLIHRIRRKLGRDTLRLAFPTNNLELCEVCCHYVIDMTRHLRSEEHKRSLRRLDKERRASQPSSI